MKLLLIIFLDQILKFLSLRLGVATINYGIAWGLFSPIKITGPCLFFSIFLFFFIFCFLLLRNKDKNRPHFLSLKLILAGGFSNLLDRAVHKGVIDYLHLPPIPTFNLADLMISLGLIFLVKSLIFDKN